MAAAGGHRSGVAGQASTDGGTRSGGGTPTTAEKAAPAAHNPGSNDESGVTNDEVVIGVHATVTGTSPIPQDSFDVGKDTYWRYLADSAPEMLFGRKVRVVFRDERHNPNEAVPVWRELVEKEKVLLLVGAGGADQNTACARYTNQVGVPSLSAGGNEEGLRDLSTYDATTISHAQQASIIVNVLKDNNVKKIGLVVADTPTFNDARTSLPMTVSAATANGRSACRACAPDAA